MQHVAGDSLGVVVGDAVREVVEHLGAKVGNHRRVGLIELLEHVHLHVGLQHSQLGPGHPLSSGAPPGEYIVARQVECGSRQAALAADPVDGAREGERVDL